MPVAVSAIHFFVFDTLDALIAVSGDRDRAFAILPLNDLSLEDAPGDAAGMLELVFAVVVGDGLMFPEGRSGTFR